MEEVVKSNLNIEVGHRIREVRTKKGFSREKLSEQAGITAQFLGQVETGRKGLSSKSIRNLSIALDIRADYLLFGHDSASQNHDLSTQSLSNLSANELVKARELLSKVAELTKEYG